MTIKTDPPLYTLIDGSTRHLLFAAVAGSRAYGLATADSDHDTRGVYALPAARYLALDTPPAQINDSRNNHVYYSLRRLLELLDAGNPSMLELVYTPADCIQFQSPVWAELLRHRAEFVSRRSVEALIGYAQGQIKKARGQNKWINQSQPEAKPQPLDHCYYLSAAATRLAPPCRPRRIAECGLDLQRHHAARVEHAHDLFRLYDYGTAAKGVFQHGQLVCQSIAKADESERFVGLLLYNRQGYERAVQDHQNYWTWRCERNQARWQQQERGELDFDAKNMMHTLRLLLSAQHIVDHAEPLVRVSADQRRFLLEVRGGEHDYDSLSRMAEEWATACRSKLDTAGLPVTAPANLSNQLLQTLTAQWEESCP